MHDFTIDIIKEKLMALKGEKRNLNTTRSLAERILRDPVTSKELADESRSAMIECEDRLGEIDVEIKQLREDLAELGVDTSD